MTLLQGLERAYSGMAFVLTLFCGLLTIMMERFLYVRRGYKREAKITAFLGWTYVLGGSLLYAVVLVFAQ